MAERQALPKKQRALLNAFPPVYGWLTPEEVRLECNARLPGSARKADLFTIAFVRRVLDAWIDVGLTDYRQVVDSKERFARQMPEDGCYRLTAAGHIVRVESMAREALERRLKPTPHRHKGRRLMNHRDRMTLTPAIKALRSIRPPHNPADIGGHVRGLERAEAIATSVAYAIENCGYGDYDLAHEDADAALEASKR